MSNHTFKIYTLGCKVNRYDSGTVKARLIASGYKSVTQNADVALISTCTVTESAIHKNKRMINKARQENPNSKLVLLGCWPKVEQEKVFELGADLIWTTSEYKELVERINKLFFTNKKFYHKIPGLSSIDRARYFLKIQDGCEQFCSYCVIPYARGEYQSRCTDEIINELKLAIKLGYEEIVLSGVHLGMYGKEKNSITKIDLVGLLTKMIKIKNIGRIRLSSIEINEVTDDLIELMQKSKKICHHLHIPLQSGTNKILKLMNRPYSLDYFKNKIQKLQKLLPDIAISTDVIVGFPGESRTDFEETCNFIKECSFSRLHVFSFSAHKKTKAFSMSDQVDKKEIEYRSKELRKIGKLLQDKHLKRYNNKKLSVVIERQTNDCFVGKTEYYFNVEFMKKDIINWHNLRSSNLLIKKIVDINFNNK